jgi:predicted ribosomally synthesized peptide with SipW-like signal peptide
MAAAGIRFPRRALFSRQLRRAAAALMCLLGVAGSNAAWSAEKQIHRHAAVGDTIRIRGHVNYRHCGDVIATTITVVQTPAHGALDIRDEMVKSTDPELGRDDKCRGYSGEGKAVYYTRTSAGSDKFQYTSSSANDVVRIDGAVD